MTRDLKIIEQLEEQIGKKLVRLSIGDLWGRRGYAVDANANVIGLSLGWSGLPDISPLKELTNLTMLELYSNQLPDISPLKELTNLTQLYLGENQLTDIRPLKELTNLSQLWLHSNRLTDISPLKELTNLTKLWLFKNRLTDISPLKELTNLTQLSLGENQLTDIRPLKELTNLTKLWLFNNQLTDISPLKELTNLTQLSLGDNQLTDISPLKELINLTQLHLNGNQLTGISPLKDLTNLIKLDLRDNKISRLPGAMADLNMEIVWFDGYFDKGINLCSNPPGKPPMEIIQKGKEAIIVWVNALEGEKKALNEVKFLLVGDGGAGKTSLVKRLLGKKFNKHEPQTHGINIGQWEVKCGKKKDKIKVNIWDFGGQEIMHATHQFFLSKRSLYVLVLDGRKDEKVEYWLKHINSFGGDSPVLVVLNKIDQNPAFDVNRLFLQEKYPNIKGFYPLSCSTGKGIKTFSQYLVQELAKVELIHTTWAQTWFSVKTQLEKVKKDFISYEEYQTLCENQTIDDKIAQDTLVGFLHDLGIVLHFKDFKLRETHVLNPEWVTNAVYKIINSKEVAAAKGLLKLNQLDNILRQQTPKDYYYPPGKHRYIVELMQKFELCYEVDSETILIPDLLAVQQPEFDFDYGAALKFRVDYDFLPRSILPRFIVKMHKDIKEELRWRTGVVLEDHTYKSLAVVKSDDEEKRIFIYVQGEQKRDYFTALLFTLRSINKSFEHLKAVEKVPMPDNAEITVSYEHLIRLEQNGMIEYMPDGSDKKYNVKELLGTVHVALEKKNEQEILQILRKLKEKSDTEETLLQKANEVFEFKINLPGVGININNLIKKLLKQK